MVRVVLALPPSRVRSGLVRYLYRRAYAAWNRRDWELNTLLHDDERYELVWPASDAIPGARERYRGVEGYIDFAELWLEAFGDFRFQLLAVDDSSRTRLVAHIRQRGRGTGSGVAIDERILSVDEIDNGRLVKQTEWRDVEAGLRANGLTPASLRE
jgi:ketosteroid isomerase-like protein